MNSGSNALETYRTSHASEGYGGHYDETYRRGYYHFQWERLEKPLLERVLGAIDGREKLDYLDFACGTGRITAVGECFFASTTGVDVASSMLEQARRKLSGVTFIEQDITKTPLDRKFDVATSFRFFLNAEQALADAAIDALHTSLKPGGLLVTNIHVNSTSVTGLAYRLRNRVMGRKVARVRSHTDFVAFLAAHGFRVKETYWYSYLPRTGWRMEWIPKYLMMPVEAVARMIPGVKRMAQSFIVVAERI